jgi:GNAT superfamily N-acetyltransferase
MESTKYDLHWWRVAVDSHRRAMGVICPVIAFGEPIVGFVGVARDHRGRGIGSALLVEAWSIMNRDGHLNLSAETDDRNIPMHWALKKSGFTRCWEKQEWRLGV